MLFGPLKNLYLEFYHSIDMTVLSFAGETTEIGCHLKYNRFELFGL